MSSSPSPKTLLLPNPASVVPGGPRRQKLARGLLQGPQPWEAGFVYPPPTLAPGWLWALEEMQPILSLPLVPKGEQGLHFFHHGAHLCHQPLLCGQLLAQPTPPCLLQPCGTAGCSLPGPHHLPGTVGSAGALGMGEARRRDNRWRA